MALAVVMYSKTDRQKFKILIQCILVKTYIRPKFICILCVRVHSTIFACVPSGYRRS